MFDILFSQFQYHIVSEDPVKMVKPLLQEKIGHHDNGNLAYKHIALKKINIKNRKIPRQANWIIVNQDKNEARNRFPSDFERSYLESLKFWTRSKHGAKMVISCVQGKAQVSEINIAFMYLFYPDIDNRSALYYAAHAGKADLVLYFLFILSNHLFRTSMQRKLFKTCSYSEGKV